LFVVKRPFYAVIFYFCEDMSTLIKNVIAIDPSSPFNGQEIDVFIKQGKIARIGQGLSEDHAKVIEGKGQSISPGWVDTFADYREPGFEYKETIVSGLNAARAGGFSDVILTPNTRPAVTNASILDFVRQKAAGHSVRLHVAGALSKDIEGKELAEMLDMHHAGAIAFSDGWQPLQDAMMMLKALEYVKAFDGIIIQIPIHASLSEGGLMNEGPHSVRLGMAAIPAVSESLLIHRDVELLRYTQSRLHFSGITTKASLDLIQEAKEDGLQVSCSVTPYHLRYSDEALSDYDSNFKVNPPLRTEEDRQALIAGVRSGIVDCIATHHRPQDIDSKNKEFEYAGWGMNCQETAWSMLLAAIPDLKPEAWVNLLSRHPRKIFNLTPVSIAEGQEAVLTLFDDHSSWVYDIRKKQSKGINNPLLGSRLRGKARSI